MVKCANCGYLSVRLRNNLSLVSPDEEQRRKGKPPASPAPETASQIMDIPVLEVKPICAIGAIRIDAEFDGELGKIPPTELKQSEENVAALVMGKDRECTQFVEWLPVLSPKEHLDKNVMKQHQTWQAKESRKMTRIIAIATLVSAVVGAVVGALLTQLPNLIHVL